METHYCPITEDIVELIEMKYGIRRGLTSLSSTDYYKYYRCPACPYETEHEWTGTENPFGVNVISNEFPDDDA